jgi:hypothetical protein
MASEVIDILMHRPLYSTEVLTISSSNTINTGQSFDPKINQQNLPLNFACRIYTDEETCGSGFVFQGVSGQPYIISAKHVYRSPFIKPTRFFACFDHDQSFKDYLQIIRLMRAGINRCDHALFEVQLNSTLSTSSVPDLDQITGLALSMDGDICSFKFTGFCLCGQTPLLPAFQFLPLATFPPIHTEVLLFGFPGGLKRHKNEVFLFSEEIRDNEFDRARTIIVENRLHVVNGETLTETGVFSISNTSVPGMSGSAVLVNNGSTWAISGVLIGGPAVRGHREICEITELVNENQKAGAERVILALKNTGWKPSLCDYLLSELRSGDLCTEDLAKTYKDCLKIAYKRLGNVDRVAQLNHNLAYEALPFLLKLN